MPKNKKEPIRLETGMMDQIMLVYGTGPVETWKVMRVWHSSQREEAERWLADLKVTVDFDGGYDTDGLTIGFPVRRKEE
jgi:hypothetical protein